MKSFVPFIVLSIVISLIAISTYKLSHEEDVAQVEESSLEDNYSFVKTKIKLKDFSLNSLFDDNKKLDLELLSKDEYVIINFFASWCSTCVAEHLNLIKLQDKKLAKIYGVAWHDISENTKYYLNKLTNPYDEVFVDAKSELGDQIDLKAVPVTLILKNSEIIYKYEGNLQSFHIEEIEKIIK